MLVAEKVSAKSLFHEFVQQTLRDKFIMINRNPETGNGVNLNGRKAKLEGQKSKRAYFYLYLSLKS